MSGDDLAEVFHAAGSSFEELWAELLTANQEGANAMARTELGEGSNLDARELAQAMIKRLEQALTELVGLETSPS